MEEKIIENERLTPHTAWDQICRDLVNPFGTEVQESHIEIYKKIWDCASAQLVGSSLQNEKLLLAITLVNRLIVLFIPSDRMSDNKLLNWQARVRVDLILEEISSHLDPLLEEKLDYLNPQLVALWYGRSSRSQNVFSLREDLRKRIEDSWEKAKIASEKQQVAIHTEVVINSLRALPFRSTEIVQTYADSIGRELNNRKVKQRRVQGLRATRH